jgi:hypothetical protein
MPQYARLQEERRTRRRTVADALDIVHQVLGLDETPQGQIRVTPLRLPSGQCTALVDVVFPDLECIVSLPTSARFRALSGTSSQRSVFEIFRLDGAEICPDRTVLLADGTRLRAVEVIPTHLPYEPSELEVQILRHVIDLTRSHHCYRSIREGLPEHLQHLVPDLRALDYSRVHTIQAPPLKLIDFVKEHGLMVSSQKIADALATFGVRVPRRRPRRGSARTGRATI